MPAAAFLDLFLQSAGLVKERRWDACLDKTAACRWDSPPVRVVAYKNRIIYLRVKPSLNATVDHFVRLLIPDGVGCTAETAYKQFKALVKPFHHFIRTRGPRKRGSEPTTLASPLIDAGLLLTQFHQKAQELADARRRLEANRQRRSALQSEMKALDDEYQEITQQVLAISESSMLLSRLLEMRNVAPIKT
jgi:hypothetical protein